MPRCQIDKTTIVIASGNAHKIQEIKTIMGPIGIRWLSGNTLDIGQVDESGSSYLENAVIKATAYSRASGKLALADDSGLEVDALGGLPGIRSNRLFGENKTQEEKILELLRRLKQVPFEKRTARFICHAVLLSDEQLLVSVQGVLDGVILSESRGKAGFGYDPVFLVPGIGKTLAQMSDAEKNICSHRGSAMRQIRDFLLRWQDQTW
ncbi:RdgB/HAM1 family non-canonical purine NTP pyrophosphatase [bacterium]|nr:RdgB/HAM1 family non-canonical purine NTP pyrophosphatase [candidate division CSSED10-310 bacterium]